jgi:ribulose-phosphate 3-epimerase
MFHAEAVSGIDEVKSLLAEIRSKGVRAGAAVNPDKPVELFLDALGEMDQALIMSVYAGFGGQQFIAGAMDKVRAVRKAADERGLNIDIEVDGGVNHETAALCASAGANVLVAGSYVFCSDDYRGRIEAVRLSAENAIQ